jgi:transcriptional regulator with XRE-family HTH domain
VQGGKVPACWESADFPEADADTYSYATRALFCDPETGRWVPASVGIVMSEGSLMIWLKNMTGPEARMQTIASHKATTGGEMSVGKRIRQLRERKGLSQGDIEAVSGMLRAYISRVEHDHTVPSLETVERFASALDVPLYQLFCEDKDALPARNPGETTDAIAKESERSGSEARMLTMLKGLTQRMAESDKQLLLDFAYQLAARSARAVEGREGEPRLGASKRQGQRKFGRLAGTNPTPLPCGTRSRAAS